MEEKELKKRLNLRSTDSSSTVEKSSFSYLEMSEVTTDSAETIPAIIKAIFLR